MEILEELEGEDITLITQNAPLAGTHTRIQRGTSSGSWKDNQKNMKGRRRREIEKNLRTMAVMRWRQLVMVREKWEGIVANVKKNIRVIKKNESTFQRSGEAPSGSWCLI